MKDVFRKKLTLTGWMHNTKSLIAVSVLLAVVLWAVVMTDNATTRQRSLTVPVAVNLNDSYASQVGLRLINEVKEDVTVTVEGSWSTVSALTTDDIQVRADVSTVQKSGKQTVTLVPSRNSNTANYEIVSCSPAQLEIECDYWDTVTVPLQVDTSALTVADSKNMQLGIPVVSAGKDGNVTVSGPQTAVRSIAKIVVKPEAEEPLGETRNFTPELKALTEKNAAVDLKNCTVEDVEGKALTVTVPVDFYKELAVSLDWHNAPKAIRENADVLKVSPKTVKVIGPKDALAALGETLTPDTVDFDHLTNKKYTWRFPLKLPEAVTCVDSVAEIKASLDLSGYSRKILAVTVSDQTVSFENNTADKKTAVQKNTVNVTAYGAKASLEKLTAADLKVSVDLAEEKENTKKTYSATLKTSAQDVWFYYGNDGTGIPAVVTLS